MNNSIMPPSIRATTEASNGAMFGTHRVQSNLATNGRRKVRIILERNGFTKEQAAAALKDMGFPEPVKKGAQNHAEK
jgi:hypothetical protein